MTQIAPFPDGYVRHDRHSPLTEPWEPLYARPQGTVIQLALRLREDHCNSRGFAHGGLVAALADNAMGMAAVMSSRDATGAGAQGAVTVSLVVDYLDSGRPGELLEFHPSVLRTGKTLSFVECRALCDGRLIARTSATYRML